GTGSGADRPPPVCFKLTGRCVGVQPKKKSAVEATQPAAKASPSRKVPLNLAAPDVRSVLPPDQLNKPLPDTEQIAEIQEADTVAVKGERDAPDVPGGFGAIWWALNHPSQAWRILALAE